MTRPGVLRHASTRLSPEVRAALLRKRAELGSLDRLAAFLGMGRNTVDALTGGGDVTAAVAERVARALG